MDSMHTLTGFAVGTLVGLTGVGGGALMTPLLVLLFGVAPATAIGTDLWFAALTKIVGGTVHGYKGSVDWEVVKRLAMGSLPAALATLLTLHWSGASRVRPELLMNTLGIALVVTAGAMLFNRRLHALGQDLRTRLPGDFKRAQPLLTVLAGAILGCLVTLTSVGAGALGAVMLVYLYPFRMKPARLVGTDIAHAIPLTLLAGSGHLAMGNVDLPLLGSLLSGSIPGILLGALLAHRAPDALLRGTIAVVLLAVGIKMIG